MFYIYKLRLFAECPLQLNKVVGTALLQVLLHFIETTISLFLNQTHQKKRRADKRNGGHTDGQSYIYIVVVIVIAVIVTVSVV